MCLIAVAWRMHPRWRLVLAGNRDEFHARPTLPLAAWDAQPDIAGGRDALHGGSWLALRGRRLATVTNVRIPNAPDGRSRGHLVADFVSGDITAEHAVDALAADAHAYRPFNLLLHDGDALAYAGNAPTFAHSRLAPGVHGLSNGPLDAPWPKVERLRGALHDWLTHASMTDAMPDIELLFAALANVDVADDAALPDTGVGLPLERMLSAAFISGTTYGTRASTVVLMGDDHAWLVERRFGPEATPLGETRMRVAYA